MTTYTYGARPGYEVRGVDGRPASAVLTFYATKGHAQSSSFPLGSVTSSGVTGSWSFTSTTGPTLWGRDTDGDVFPLAADEADYATEADVAAAASTASTAQADAALARQEAAAALVAAQSTSGGGMSVAYRPTEDVAGLDQGALVIVAPSPGV